MAVVEIAAVRVVALWLGDGRLTTGASLLDVEACADLENIMRSLRLVRRWDIFASTRMLVGIQNARIAFTRSSAIMNCTILANHVEGLRVDLRAADDLDARAVVKKAVGKGAFAVSRAWVNDEAGGFVEDEEVFILEKNAQRHLLRGEG